MQPEMQKLQWISGFEQDVQRRAVGLHPAVDEPFMLRNRSAEEQTEYDAGFTAGQEGRDCDVTKSLAWQRGWTEAQE